MGDSTPRAEAALVGRDRERRRIAEFIDRGAGSPLVILGEAGIGKTTLWNHGIELARAAGHRVLIGRPSEDDAASPTIGLRDLFDQPDVRPCDVPGSALALDVDATERGRSVLQTLRELSRDAPVLVAIDDLQWLDLVSARAIRYAFHRFSGEPVALFATHRSWSPGDIEPSMRRLPRNIDPLDLEPMSITEIRDVLDGRGLTVPRPDLTRLHDLARGNPMYAVELARLGGRTRSGCEPGSRVGVLAASIAELPAETRRIARCLAVAGPTAVGIVEQVADIDDIEAAVRDGVDAEVLTVDDDFTISFTHPLFAAAVAADTNALDRRSLHAALVDLVDAPDARALHLARSTSDPDAEVADELGAAAQHAADRAATDLAADLFEHAARLTPPDDRTLRFRRLLDEVVNRAASGQTRRALELADALLAQRPTGEQLIETVTHRVFLDFAESERFLLNALADAGDSRLEGRLRDMLGWQLGTYRGRLAEGAEHSAMALELGRETGDDELTMLAGATLSTISLLRGRPRPDLLADALTISQGAPSPCLGRWPRVFRARHDLWNGFLSRARCELELMQQRAIDLGSEFQRPYRLHDLAMVELAAGDLRLARRCADEGIEAADDAGNEQAVTWLAYPLGLASAHLGDHETARWAANHLEAAAHQYLEPPRAVMASDVHGAMAVHDGRWSDARTHLLDGVEILGSLGFAHPAPIPVLVRAIEAAAWCGDAELVDRLTRDLELHTAHLTGPWIEAQIAAARGTEALVSGDAEAAMETLGSAAADLERIGYGLDALRVRVMHGRACLRAGQRTLGRTQLTNARAEFGGRGLGGWVGTVDDLFGRIEPDPTSVLTAAEQAIADLVAVGRRNREIAAELFVSVSTVEAHLTRLYRKLGVRNRTELTQLVGAEASLSTVDA